MQTYGSVNPGTYNSPGQGINSYVLSRSFNVTLGIPSTVHQKRNVYCIFATIIVSP